VREITVRSIISHERADPSTASSIRASSGADVARATPVPAQMWEVCGEHARYAVWEVCEHGAMLAQVSQQGARLWGGIQGGCIAAS
jgi:hypothetical protein